MDDGCADYYYLILVNGEDDFRNSFYTFEQAWKRYCEIGLARLGFLGLSLVKSWHHGSKVLLLWHNGVCVYMEAQRNA